MPIRPEVRSTQRILAALDAAHARAVAALEQALARRSEALATHDRLVAEAQASVDAAIADMAAQVSPELTAQLLDVDRAVVRRCVRSAGTHAKASPSCGAERRAS